MEYVKTILDTAADQLITALENFDTTDTPTKEQLAAGFLLFPQGKHWLKQELALEECKKLQIGGHNGG